MIGHQLAELEPGHGGCHRSDAQRVEEIDHRAQQQRFGARPQPLRDGRAEQNHAVERRGERQQRQKDVEHRFVPSRPVVQRNANKAATATGVNRDGANLL